MNKTELFTEFFVKRPILTCVIMLVPTILGLMFLMDLKIQLVPTVHESFIGVSIKSPGASQNVIAKSITTPFEEALSVVKGLKLMTSISEAGESKISMIFNHSKNNAEITSDVLEILSANKHILPEGAQDPSITKTKFSTDPMLYLSVSSNEITNEQLDQLVKNSLKRDLQYVEGVAKVEIYGSADSILKILIDPVKMSRHNLTPTHILTAVNTQNFNISAGKTSDIAQERYITMNANLDNINDFLNIVVGNTDYPIRLGDVATVSFEKQDASSIALINGKKTILIGIFPAENANLISVSANIKKFIADNARALLSRGLDLQIVLDNSTFVSNSINEVKTTIFESIIFVAIVVFLFLGSIRSSLVPMMAIPFSIIPVFIVLYLFNYSINIITLLAIVFAIGLVVDDAIVILENIEKHIKRGANVLEACITGSQEMIWPVITISLTLVAIYLPIIFIKGPISTLFSEFAITLVSTVIFSAIFSITFTPMVAARILTHTKPKKIVILLENYYLKLEALYNKSLNFFLTYRIRSVFMILLVSISSIFYFSDKLDEEFTPKEDLGIVYLAHIFPTHTKVQHIHKYVTKINDVLKFNDINHLINIIMTPISKNWLILKPSTTRQNSSFNILEQVKQELAKIAVGGEITFSTGGIFNNISSSSEKELTFVLTAPRSYEEIYEGLNILKSNTKGIVSNYTIMQEGHIAEYILDIKRDKCLALGFDPKSVGEIFDLAINGRKVGLFYHNDQKHDIVVLVDDKYRQTISNLETIYIQGKSGVQTDHLIRLSDLVDIQKKTSFAQVHHYNQKLNLKIQAQLNSGITLKEGFKALDLAAQKLPKGLQFSYVDSTLEMLSSLKSLILVFILGLLFIYMFLAASFENLVDPSIIILTVPLALSGALSAMYITNCTINIYTQICLITLVGLITKHGILLVNRSNAILQTSKSIRIAVIEGAVSRFKPIIMTSLAIILGALPLLLTSGESYESRRQIAWTMIGGMSIGTLFTIYAVPLIFSFIKRFKTST